MKSAGRGRFSSPYRINTCFASEFQTPHCEFVAIVSHHHLHKMMTPLWMHLGCQAAMMGVIPTVEKLFDPL